jgi:putative peptidoglycan lipid II flippase
MFLLRAQIVRLVYGAGDKFTWEDTRLTAAVLGIFAFGILFQALIPFLARVFFSTQNTRTPTYISIASVVLNIFLAVLLMNVLETPSALRDLLLSGLRLHGISDIRILAFPLALVISGIFQGVLLMVFLRKYVRGVIGRDLCVSILKIAISSVALSLTTYAILQLYGGTFALRTYSEVLIQLVLASLGGALAFIATALLIRSPANRCDSGHCICL